MMHHNIEKMIKPPTIMTPMTGHLSLSAITSHAPSSCGWTYLQKLTDMQLSQLEMAVLKSLIWFPAFSTVDMIWRLSTLAVMLDITDPHTPPRRLRAMATSIVGIFNVEMPRSLRAMNGVLGGIPTKDGYAVEYGWLRE